MNRPTRDPWLRATQSIPLNIAEGNGKHSLNDKNRFFEIARGSALECASIHDFLVVCGATNVESSRIGKSDLKRIVSMLTRLIQRTEAVSEGAIDYEEMPEQRNPPEPSVASSLMENHTRRLRCSQPFGEGVLVMKKQPSGNESGADWKARFNCNRQPEVKVLEKAVAGMPRPS